MWRTPALRASVTALSWSSLSCQVPRPSAGIEAPVLSSKVVMLSRCRSAVVQCVMGVARFWVKHSRQTGCTSTRRRAIYHKTSHSYHLTSFVEYQLKTYLEHHTTLMYVNCYVSTATVASMTLKFNRWWKHGRTVQGLQ